MDGNIRAIGLAELQASPAVSTPEPALPDGTLKSPYPPVAARPTQEGPTGVRFDFNHGARVEVPGVEGGKWRVRLRDLDTDNILFESENFGALVTSTKKYFVRFGIDVYQFTAGGGDVKVFTHEYNARDREVLILFPVGTLGDTLAWFPYAARFAAVHGCHLTCAMSGLIIPLLQESYPDIRFMTHEEVTASKPQETAYATYYLGLFFDDTDNIFQPTDFRHVGLHRTAAYILGVDPVDEHSRFIHPDGSRPIPERYVCIAVQASSACKYWNNPNGWHDIVDFLKQHDYEVVCIDQKRVHGSGLTWTHIPHGVRDETGDRPLVERARWLRHAEFFVGLGSGLSWLAWAVGCRVVLISGFSHPDTEFSTPWRVINWHTCNSCWNDVRIRFDHKDFLWCPRHAGSSRQFECTRLITPKHVSQVIQRIPGFRSRCSLQDNSRA
jgi:autotransporter strand-loop-strand O-heptosyltransferase